jgi:hypothetical protein
MNYQSLHHLLVYAINQPGDQSGCSSKGVKGHNEVDRTHDTEIMLMTKAATSAS